MCHDPLPHAHASRSPFTRTMPFSTKSSSCTAQHSTQHTQLKTAQSGKAQTRLWLTVQLRYCSSSSETTQLAYSTHTYGQVMCCFYFQHRSQHDLARPYMHTLSLLSDFAGPDNCGFVASPACSNALLAASDDDASPHPSTSQENWGLEVTLHCLILHMTAPNSAVQPYYPPHLAVKSV